ncbi:murein biosynthesis integral membrane protein MurJ [Frankia sp. Mgl5]|uniref:murein biosynthesis integral membrane protein MurJ n=1 Tax=Frankia sp. Mgl5 TaxID=2933793 RepID=UPI002010A4E6|nr:murein biosynthesis integral membrane protein MurJ [Frankia sp. Mgl5]MCK9930065.1 murein biosynthesis integral membrane protein MurJ [Frankia sp. Mgl5]
MARASRGPGRIRVPAAATGRPVTPPDESRWPPDDDHHGTRDGQGTPRYPDDRYPDERYPDDRYPDRRYPDERYADGGYAGGQDGGRYAGGSYPDDGYAHDQRRDVGYDNGYPGGYPEDRHDGRRPEERYEGGARPDGRYDGGGYPANPASRYGDGGYDDRPYRDSPYPDDRYADAGEPHRPGSPFPHADEHPARYRPNVNRPAQDPPAPWGDPEPPSDRPPGPPPYEPARHEWDPRDGGPRHDRSRPRYDDPPYDQPQHDQPQYDGPQHDEPPYGDRRYDGPDEARYDGSRHSEPRYGEPRYDDSRYGTPGQPPTYEERPDRGGEPPAWYADGSHATARVPTGSAYPDTPPPVPGRRRSDPDDPYDAAPHPTGPRRSDPNAGMSPQSYQEGGAEIGRRPAGGRPPAGEQTRRLPSAPAVPPPSEGGPAMWSSRSRTPAPGAAPRAGAGSARRTRPPVEPLDGPHVEPLVEPLDEVAADDRTSRLAPPVTPPPASTRRPAAEGARPAGRRPAASKQGTGRPATGKQAAGKQGTGAARGAATAKRGGLGRASGTMAIGTIASRASGFLRTVAIAAAIGTGAVGQAFNVANTTPNILYDLLLGGILTSVIVPVLVQASKEDPDGGDGFASSLITLMVLGLGAAVLVGMFAAPQIISLYLNTGPAQRELGADLLRWFMPQILFYGIGATLGAILNTRQSFAAPMFAPVLNNLVVIVTCLVFIFLPGPRPPTLGGITDAQKFVLAGGTTLGVVVMTIALLPSVRAVGFRYRPRLDLRHPGLRTSSRLAGWTLLYVLISQLGYVMITRLSSSTTAYSIYSYAYQIFQLPYAIIGVSVITALLPRMSGHAASEQADLVREDLSTASRMTVTAIVPSALFLLALGRPIAVTVFNHGAVDYDDAIAIGDTLSAFAIALVPFSLFQVQLRAFYAYRDSRTPALVNIGVVATNVLAAFVLSEVVAEKHRAAALALAFSLAYLIGLVATTVLLRRRLRGIDGNRIARVTTRVSVTAGVGAVLASVVADGLRDLLGRGWLGSGVAVVLALVVGGLAFVVISVRTGMHEMTALMRIVGGRLGVGRRTKPAVASASTGTGTASSARPPRSAGRGDGGREDGGRGRPPGGRGDRGGRGGPSGRPGGPPGRRGGSSGRRG